MRLIDADALMKKLNEDPIGQTIVQRYNIDGFIEAFPTADVVERKRGHWINRSLNICYPEWERYTCSECGKHADGYEFCPYCGTDMRGDDNADKI